MVHSSLEISTLKSYLLFFSSFFSSSEIRSSPYRLPSLSSPLFTSPLTHIFNRSEYLLSEKQIRSFLWFSNNPPPVIEDTLPPFTLFFLLFFPHPRRPSTEGGNTKAKGKTKSKRKSRVVMETNRARKIVSVSRLVNETFHPFFMASVADSKVA